LTRGRPRLVRRLTAVATAAGLVALALLGCSDWGREQLRLSFTQQSTVATQLYFAAAPDRRACDPRSEANLDFVVTPGQDFQRHIHYSVTVNSVGAANRVLRGSIEPANGPVLTRLRFSEPTAQSYFAAIALDGMPQRLTRRCGSDKQR
jgi:hypothetical protein